MAIQIRGHQSTEIEVAVSSGLKTDAFSKGK